MQKNINDIIPPSRRRALEGTSAPSYTSSGGRPDYGVPPPPQRPVRTRRSGGGFPKITVGIALVLILASIAALFVFANAEVEVEASERSVDIAGEFIATASSGDLPFEVLTVEKVATAEVPSEGTETVNQPAQGTITIENRQETPQELIKNTRFETTDGKIFRIRDSVSVPGGSAANPGTLTATVYADAAGAEYNVGPTTFTLPGLAGTGTFELVRARSTEPMKGGFSGPRPSVSEATAETQSAELRKNLEPEIGETLAAAIPEGYVLVPGASRINYETAPVEASGDTVTLSEKAVATAVIFPKEALARAVARQSYGSYTGEPITLATDASSMRLTPVGDIPSAGATEFAFSLSGSTGLLWLVDNEQIAGAVAGKSKAAAETALEGLPAVETGRLILRPFWRSSFPSDPEKIKVTVQNPPKP